MESPCGKIEFLCYLWFGVLAKLVKIINGRRFSTSVDASFEALCVLYMHESIWTYRCLRAGTSRSSLVSQGVIKYACGIANICVNVMLM